MTPGTRVLLTGATGFIGAEVARQLAARGCQVSAVVRPASNRWRLSGLIDSGAVSPVESDIDDVNACRALVGSVAPDLLIHLAWFAGAGRSPDSPKNYDSLEGSIALLEGVAGTPCRRVVVSGTSVEYDPDLGHVSESSPIRPRSVYGACKATLARTGAGLGRRSGWGYAHARIFNVYGPGEDDRRLVAHVVNSVLRGEPCALTSGRQVRDYLHVADVASALVALASAEVEGPVNIASARPVTVASVAETVARLLGRPDLLRPGALPDRPNESARLTADNRLLVERTCWSPRFGLEAGLRHTIDARKAVRVEAA